MLYSSKTDAVTGKPIYELIQYPIGSTNTSYEIINGCTSLECECLFGAKNLTSLTISDTVKELGQNAINKCNSLTSIVIPENVEKIGNRAVAYNNDLTSITIISENVEKSVSEGAFMGDDKVQSIEIPKLVTKITDGAFSGMRDLTELTVSPSNEKYKSENNLLLTKDGTKIISAAGGKTGTYTMPETVKEIGKYAFYECENITGVTLSSNVTNILSRAFYHCKNLNEIVIPSTVETIESDSFKDTGLTSIKIKKAENSISGTPWGATTAQVLWNQ